MALDLAWLLGSFEGRDVVHGSQWADAEDVSARAEGVAEIGADVVVLRMTELRAAGTFDSLNVFMVDPGSGEVLLYGFDSIGYPPDPPARGVVEGERLTLDRTTARGNSRTEFVARPEGFAWTKLFRRSAADEWTTVVTGTFDRVS